MANLKTLRARKKSVQATRKITAAMKMIAAAKLQKAQKRAEDARPYARLMAGIMQDLIAARATQSGGPALLSGTGKEDAHLVIVTTSNRGLCGGFNAQPVRLAKRHIDQLLADGKSVKILCLGRKGREQLKRDYAGLILDTHPTLENPRFYDASQLGQKIVGMFERGDFDCCTLFYNKFISALRNKPIAQQLIPFQALQDDIAFKEEAADKTALSSIYEYEPSKFEVLSELLPRNLSIQLYRAILENAASEHAARMTAMDGATRNAGDMIHQLDLVINRTRQAQITMELTEIISGAEAL